MRLVVHLTEDTVGDIIVSPPVGRPFGIGKLIHIMAVQLAGQGFGGGIDFAGAIDEMAAAAVELNLFNFTFCRTGRHHGDKRQA